MMTVWVNRIKLLIFILGFYEYIFSNIPNASILNHQTRLSSLSFRENKGQVHDQNYKARSDVLFSGTDGNIYFHLKKNGLHYQLFSVKGWKKESLNGKYHHDSIVSPASVEIYRVDISWIGANPNPEIIPEEPLPGYENFYLPPCPEGALFVKSYKRVTYKDIYPGIDLEFNSKEGVFHYDFIVNPGADYKIIKIKIEGAEKVEMDATGQIKIKTPFGYIIEEIPVVYQNEKKIISQWTLEKNVLSFSIEPVHCDTPFVIDPAVRNWGTYYGGVSYDWAFSVSVDALSNVYITGHTSSPANIATTGTHQPNLFSGWDAYIAKFSIDGSRLWGTYYGGESSDACYSSDVDENGNIYITGYTWSDSVIATNGSHQNNRGGQSDIYFAKFNSSGMLEWGTFYGGIGGEEGMACHISTDGYLYIAGSTSSPDSIATSGSFQPTYSSSSDGFLLKFTTSGARIWATYYGELGGDFIVGCVTDQGGNIYCVGSTTSEASITTSGTHQPLFAGLIDAFLVKFNNSGTRLWGTYYGGSNYEEAYGCAIDSLGYLYFTGYTQSTYGIATFGSHQYNINGTRNGFLAKFNGNGTRVWGTYYGGSNGWDEGRACEIGILGDVYLAGRAESNSGAISTSGSYQPTYGGWTDAFLAKFNSNGVRQWGTYYGGQNIDVAEDCIIDKFENIYIAGWTRSDSVIASLGAHQEYYVDEDDAFLAQFCSNPPLQPDSIIGPSFVCVNQDAIYFMIGSTANCTWTVPTDATILSGQGTDTIYVNFGINSGIVSVSAQNTCGVSTSTSLYVVLDSVKPNAIISSSSNTICQGGSVLLTVTGGKSYLWSTGELNDSIWVFPTFDTTYSVTVTGNNGCDSTPPLVNISVKPNPSPAITSNNSSPLCKGDSIQLTADSAISYQWNTGETTQSITVFETGTFTVIVKYFNDCVNISSQFPVIINDNPIPVISPSGPTIFCLGSNVSLICDSGYLNYSWNTGDTSNVIVVDTSGTYYVIVNDSNGCSNDSISTGITVTVNPLPIITISGVDSICKGDTSVIIATGGLFYYWSNGSYNDTVFFAPTTTTSISVDVYDGTCTTSDSFTVYVRLLNYTISGDTLICQDSSTMLVATGAAYYIFLWDDSIPSQSIKVSPTVTKTYSVLISDSLCSEKASITVYVVQPPEPELIASDTIICQDETVEISASGGNYYYWSTGDTSSVISTKTFKEGETVYKVIIGNEGCVLLDSISIYTLPRTNADAGENVAITIGESTKLLANGGIAYNWYPSFGLSCTSCQDPTANPIQTTTFFVEVSDSNGCTGTDSIVVFVDLNCGDLFIPNIFSPNGDGKNDILYVYGKCIRNLSFIIFDYWGEKVFESTDTHTGWDGKFKGKDAEGIVFVYYTRAELITGKNVELKGNVTIVR